ncbi:unnamed protein product, partial [Mesorhabditis belari]|uniref:C3H1-type domain-containing protein n=1 Tax=Mesorhabditis belari TaxID=2138241 RepID=A0AAF3F3H0_9BILA
MERSHAPLRRVMKGPPAKVDPTLQKTQEKQEKRQQQQLFQLQHQQNGHDEEKNEKRLSTRSIVSEQDSCYSSCSEESHASLSRESSDALSTHLGTLSLSDGESGRGSVTPCALPSELLEFAVSLGYTEQQLHKALAAVGPNAGQDNILAELVRGGQPTSSLCSSRVPSQISIPAVVSSPSTSANSPQLRSIVIDGSNIAMTHGRKEVFSCSGIRDCVHFFLQRGHNDVLVFIPQFRKEAARADCPITDQHVLTELDARKHIVWTPSRRINGRRIVCHDDRYILKTAEEKDAVIVSNDEYRDLVRENPQYRKLVENRLLMYSFVDGKFMPPDDPLGRHGPSLSQFLSKGVPHTAQICPYGRKCTYGNKCRYFHPERPNGIHTSVTERLMRENCRGGQKPSLSTRPSMIYEGSPLSALTGSNHQTVARTQSLNVNVEGRMGDSPRRGILQSINHHIPPQGPFMNAPPLPAWHHHIQHQALSRNASAPLGDQLRAQDSSSPTSRCNSLLDMSLGRMFPFVPPPQPQSHLFSPSQPGIWGHSEFSLTPINTTTELVDPTYDESRARLQYHLSQLFPSTAVAAVMAAHPDEKDPQRLCEIIIAFHKGFNQAL